MTQVSDDVREIKERVIRLESRVVQLGDHVGANLRTRQRIDIKGETTERETWVEIDALDVSISRIFAELEKFGWSGPINVLWKGARVATLYVP